MHLTLLLAGALLPAKLAVALSVSLDTPNLKARLSRATLVETTARSPSTIAESGNAHLDWLARRLFNQVSPAATAPYALRHLSGAAPSSFVWHADPVHVEVARDHLIVQPLGAHAPTSDETAQLLSVANTLLSPFDCTLVAVKDRWFLLNEHDWKIEAAPLAAVMGSSVTLPSGADAQQWNRLHNEIQISWHAHVVNHQRDAIGAPTINALWLHSGGRLKPLPAIGFTQVQSDASEWQGAAAAAGAHPCPLDADAVEGALLVSDDLLIPRRNEDWAAWLERAATIDQRVGRYQGDAIDLVLTGSTVRTFASRPVDRYKPWRRRSLTEALTE